MKVRLSALLLLASVMLAGAASAVAGGQARPRAFDPDLLRNGDIIRYRDLKRADFRGNEPPPETAGMHGRLGAATCVFLATDPDTAIRATAPDETNGLVRAQVEDLRFIAFMDRDCSWWNPRPMTLPADYILQHEQIHFALFEIAARRLNHRADELTRRMQTVTSTQQQAVDHIHRHIDIEMQRALDEILARGNDFDRETSRTYRQDRQNWWWETVSRELARFSGDH